MDLHILPLYPPPCPPSHDVPASETESLCHMDPLPAASPHPHYKHTPHLALQSLLFLESFLSLYINSLQKGSPPSPREGCFVCWNAPGLPSVPICTLSFPHTCGKYLGHLVYGLGVSLPSAGRLSPQPHITLYWADVRRLINSLIL